MVSLKSLLGHLESKRTSRVELVSGRRPRLVLGAGKEKADFQNLADEALTDDEVIAICESAGGRKQVDALDEHGASWVHMHGGAPVKVIVEMRGREIAAIFTAHTPEPAPSSPGGGNLPPGRKNTQTKQQQQKRTMPEMRAPQPSRQKTIPPEAARARRTVPPPTRRSTPGPQDRQPRKATVPPAASHRDRATQAAIPRTIAPPEPERTPERTPERAPERQPERAPERQPERAPERQPERAPERDQALARIQVEQVLAPNPAKIADKSRKLARFAWSSEQASASRVAELLEEGRAAGASDLHVTADGGGPASRRPLLRVAGALTEARTNLASHEREAAILALVPLASRSALETRGGADFALDAPRLGRFRVNVTITARGLKASLRFIPDEVPTIASLGLPDALRAATDQHQGLIIVTGPAGHGKTTTLAALVDHINSTRAHHVITVEDPIEVVHPIKMAILTQREVGGHTRSFARALKGALRQDPDVIVVGELRDTETVRMALSASETGHLVIATMNTPSASHTIDALIDFFPPGDQAQVRATLGGGLKYIVSQRLVPRADGKGSVAAIETLPGSMPLWNMIRDQKTFQLPSLMQRGKGAGIIRLNDSLAELVQRGVVTLEEAMRSALNPEELQLFLKVEPAPAAAPPSRELPGEKRVGQLLERAGAFFSRKGGS